MCDANLYHTPTWVNPSHTRIMHAHSFSTLPFRANETSWSVDVQVLCTQNCERITSNLFNPSWSYDIWRLLSISCRSSYETEPFSISPNLLGSLAQFGRLATVLFTRARGQMELLKVRAVVARVPSLNAVGCAIVPKNAHRASSTCAVWYGNMICPYTFFAF